MTREYMHTKTVTRAGQQRVRGDSLRRMVSRRGLGISARTTGCKCIAETETQLREKLEGDLAKMKPSKDAKMKSLMPKNGAILWSTGRWILNIPFEATWTLANGKQKETTVNMIASHCPFCGRPAGEKT